MQAPYDEKKALALLALGSETAFRQIYDQYAPAIYRVATRYFQSAELAEDLVQEIFSSLWLKREEFCRVQEFRFYLFTMAKNLAITYLKKMARQSLVNQEFSDRQGIDSTNFDRYEELLQQAVAQLPPQQKQIFNMAKVNGMSHEHIARQLNLSPSTVNNHMVAALKFIRQHVPRYIIQLAFIQRLFDQ
ncbi:RNA polymerase sigma-70 factor [Fulvivirgaceae bacterium PWU4]|uniref:RNA polymerase sigma-70 factor n=1 Tax=Chryseosolibacter histidini TaxID=2782349 RepID=A0AAP2DLY6_9BACT|nr:RNA polymerase sigma-70 factor [Chryseosolibacter histidini]MBT1697924.1 RNA polymerase sigma-70 factor [Chryseosolibacter histidini]